MLPRQKFDITFWLVKIDKAAKKIDLISGVNLYAKSKISGFKADAKSVSFTMTTPLPNGTERVTLVALPPRDPKGDLMRGTLVAGGTLTPVWLQKTTMTELTAANAARVTPGFPEVEAALKHTDSKERLKDLRAVAAKYPGQPVQFLALQGQMSELIKQKADAVALREVALEYRKMAREHGDEFLAGANLDLARNLMDHPNALPVAVESARESVRSLRPEHHIALRMSAYLTLAAGLHKTGKTNEIKPIVEQLSLLGEQSMRQVKGQPQQEISALQQLAVMMLTSPSPLVGDLGLSYARRAAKLLKDDMPLAARATTYKLLERALEARGKADEAKALLPTIEKLDAELDRNYLKALITFKVEPFKARKGASDRVALVELFTGARYPQAVAAGIAYDAAMQRYTPKEVVFFQYQVAINPQDLDPLVNRDSEARKAFYTADLESVPSMFVDGKLTPALGGAAPRGQESYDIAKEAIDKAVESEAMAKIKLDVSRTGDTITAKADVSGLRETGAKVRLRFALVEQAVRYNGPNGLRLHHHVLRAFIGGEGGFKLEKPEVTQSASVILPQLRKQLADYIAESAKKAKAPWPERPLALAKLKVIAWVQDEDSKQVYQAAQADVPGR
jgi:hypothetical protein